jgi:hypothetical protein
MAIGVERIALAAGVVKDCGNCAHRDCMNEAGEDNPCKGYWKKGRCGGWSPDDDTIDAALAVLCPVKED